MGRVTENPTWPEGFLVTQTGKKFANPKKTHFIYLKTQNKPKKTFENPTQTQKNFQNPKPTFGNPTHHYLIA